MKSKSSPTVTFEDFIVHLDTDSTGIDFKEFVELSQSIETTCKSMSQLLFQDNKCKLFVRPPTHGSLNLWYTIVIPVGLSIGLTMADAFLEELTGHDYKYYAKRVSRALIDCVKAAYLTQSHNLRAFARKVTPEDEGNIEQIIKAQTDFYTTLNKDNSIRGVGFSEEHTFPVQRKDFAFYTSHDIERQQDSTHEIKELIISKSSNIAGNAKWEFKDKSTGKTVFATIDDIDFNRLFLGGKSPLRSTKKDDEIVALVEYKHGTKNGIEKPADAHIIEIYRFNKKILKQMPHEPVFTNTNTDKQMELF